MNSLFQRLALITGEDVLERLAAARVIVFGLGGVGSWCAEALVRSGIMDITIVDSDTVCVTNINRQVQATSKTIGEYKASVLKTRLLEINPDCNVSAINKVFAAHSAGARNAGAHSADEFKLDSFDYIIDAIDSLTCKLDLIEMAAGGGCNGKLFSCMGMAQKLDPTQIKIADIWQTEGCPLARLVRSGLRKRNFSAHFTVVYSKERLPLNTDVVASCGTYACLCSSKNKCGAHEWCSSKKIINGSAVTVTAAAGLALASWVIRDVVNYIAL
jgi:tRNA A37 threonylcarbamoyladenosine dehydratase